MVFVVKIRFLMPALNDLFLVVFLTVVFAVAYAVVFSIVFGIRDNYLRYYQKAELQWTGPRGKLPRKTIRLLWLLLVAFITALVVRLSFF